MEELLIDAAQRGDGQRVNDTIMLGAKIKDGEALIQAIIFDQREIVELLLHMGVDPNVNNRDPLYQCASFNRPAIAILLVDRGAIVDKEDDDALLEAMRLQHDDMIDILMSKGADCSHHQFCEMGL